MDYSEDIFSFIAREEKNYQTLPVNPVEGWDWNMSEHIRLSVLYKNSQFSQGNDKKSRDSKPYKNIVRPLLNLQYRSEGFDVKDVQLFVNDAYEYYKSLLVRKFHEKWARGNKMDTFIDQMVESYIDLGGALVKDVDDVRPEIVPLQRIAFCDQTDILSGPLCEKHYYSPDQLMEMSKKGWQHIEDVIQDAENNKSAVTTQGGKQSKTPGKYIEIYELHGVLPTWWLTDEPENTEDTERYMRQLYIVSFHMSSEGKQNGVVLFKSKEKKSPYKFLARDEIYGRTLGLGGVEELVEPQIWTNYDLIRMQGMLDAASKILLKTTDPTLRSKHPSGLKNVDNLEILDIAPNADLTQVDTFPRNLALFENSVAHWWESAQLNAAATDASLGESPSSGTPFALQNLIVQQGQQLHDYRRGKLAVFVDEIYREWIMPHIKQEIIQDQTFLADLDLDELQQVADSLVTCKANELIKEKILNGETIDPAEVDTYKQQVREQFMKGGNRKFMQILKDELKDLPLDVMVNIKGKQKDLAAVVDKMSRVMQFAFSTYNPQTGQFGIFQDPRMAQLFNEMLEYSGLNQIDYGNQPKQPLQTMQSLQPQSQPQPALVGAGQIQ